MRCPIIRVQRSSTILLNAKEKEQDLQLDESVGLQIPDSNALGEWKAKNNLQVSCKAVVGELLIVRESFKIRSGGALQKGWQFGKTSSGIPRICQGTTLEMPKPGGKITTGKTFWKDAMCCHYEAPVTKM